MTILTLAQVRDLVEKCIDLITVDAKGLAEAKERCAKFLTAQALMTNYMEVLEVEIGKHDAVTEAALSRAVSEADAKNVTEKKLLAQANPSYSRPKIKLSELKAQHTWLKTHMKIMENAHIMYRQYIRD